MKYTFFLDIDGTLLWKTRTPTGTLLAVVSEAQRLGHRFFINTARPFSNVDPKFFPVSRFDGLCTGCGTNIRYQGKTIYEHVIPREILLGALDIILKNQPELSLILEGTQALYYNGVNRNWEGIQNIRYTSSADVRERFPDITIQKMATYDRTLVKTETADLISESFDTYFHQNYSEIVPKGYSKGKAAEIVEHLLSIPHEATVAIGDSFNDMPMFDFCATAVAMGNAPDEIKKKCDIVTESAEFDGAAKAIARLCGISYQRLSLSDC